MVPFRHRDLLGSRGDPIPQRLHEINLLIDRKIVKPRRRCGNHLGHGGSTFDQDYSAKPCTGKARTDDGSAKTAVRLETRQRVGDTPGRNQSRSSSSWGKTQVSWRYRCEPDRASPNKSLKQRLPFSSPLMFFSSRMNLEREPQTSYYQPHLIPYSSPENSRPSWQTTNSAHRSQHEAYSFR